MTGFDGFQNFWMRQVNARGVAGGRVIVEREGLSRLKFDCAVGEGADAQLRALKVGQNADRAPNLLFHIADARYQRAHQLVIGMAHIDAEDIGAGFEQFTDFRLFR